MLSLACERKILLARRVNNSRVTLETYSDPARATIGRRLSPRNELSWASVERVLTSSSFSVPPSSRSFSSKRDCHKSPGERSGVADPAGCAGSPRVHKSVCRVLNYFQIGLSALFTVLRSSVDRAACGNGDPSRRGFNST